MAFECQTSVNVSKGKSEIGLLVNSRCQQQIESEEHQVKPTPVSKSNQTLKPNNNNNKDVRLSLNDLPSAMISEILDYLDPKDLGMVSCVSTNLHRLASDHHVWKDFYCERWGPPPLLPLPSQSQSLPSWKEMFVERDFRSRTFLGRYSIDVLYGHTEPVRAVALLVSAKLVFTSGYDSVIRMWDLEDGLAIASSQPLGCTVRAIAADANLLVVGTTDGFVHGWRAVEGLPHLFDIRGLGDEGSQFRVWEHEGPVTSLALDHTKIFSGSWDMTVRVWDRNSLLCLRVLRHRDWVYSLAPSETTLASSAGPDVYLWDVASGKLTAVMRNAHGEGGCTYTLARSHTGNLLFTGGADGTVHMFEGDSKVATWVPHMGPVHALAFEFPWLVSASGDGKMALINVRRLVRTRRRDPRNRAVAAASSSSSSAPSVEPPQRMLHGFGNNLFAVAIGEDRIVCGGEEGVVRIWNFTMALERERVARAMRGVRAENRMRRRRLLAEIGTNKCGTAGGDAKKSSVNGDRTGVWHSKRGITSKCKA